MMILLLNCFCEEEVISTLCAILAVSFYFVTISNKVIKQIYALIAAAVALEEA